MLIGGEKLQQECFLHKLSACFPLQDPQQLDEQTPLSFLSRSLEYSRADKSISLHLPAAFYSELLRRYSLEDAPATSSPEVELGTEAPRWTNIILDAEKTKLYRQTVGDLQWFSLCRPDISFAVQQLSNSFMKPTESHEHQLVNVLRYLKGTQHYSISLQPPRRWKKAKNLELLAFYSVSWSGACRSISGLSLSFMGVPLATSSTRQATSTKAAELDSVRMACTQAIHTKSLLQDLQLDQPIALRVLTGGPLAEQLGLSRNNRHLHLWSWFGQFELSKVGSQQNLATPVQNWCAQGFFSNPMQKGLLPDHYSQQSLGGVGQDFFTGMCCDFLLSSNPSQEGVLACVPNSECQIWWRERGKRRPCVQWFFMGRLCH